MENQNAEEKKENVIQGDVLSAPSQSVAGGVPAVDANEEKKNLKIFSLSLTASIAAIAILVAGAGAYLAYAKGNTGRFTDTVAKILRLPVMKINGERALYSDYAEDMRAIGTLSDYIVKARAQDKADPSKLTKMQQSVLNSAPEQSPTREQMSDQVLLRLIDNILLNKAAKDYGVRVDQAEIDQALSTILKSYKTTAEADQELKDLYGWNMDIYLKKVLTPSLLQQKIIAKFQTDEEKQKVQVQAQAVLDQIKGGADFAALAKKYGQDATAVNGGDLGWFAKGAMVKPFEDAVFALKKGDLDQNLVVTDFGYHIVRLNDTKTVKQKDSNGKEVAVVQVQASHILFRFPDLGTYMDNMLRQADAHVYGKIHNPLTNLFQPNTTATTTAS